MNIHILKEAHININKNKMLNKNTPPLKDINLQECIQRKAAHQSSEI